MRIEDLMKYDFEGNNVREIRCGIKIYSNLRGRVGVVFNEDKMTYNGIPVVCDSSIHNYECVLIHSTSENFYEEIVKNLKDEANKLNKKLTAIREAVNIGEDKRVDMNLYIATLKSLRDTLDLISKYDWTLHYSEYGITDGKHQVSVWEQNHDSQIRNHKIWNVQEAMEVVAKTTVESGRIVGNALKSVSEKINDNI